MTALERLTRLEELEADGSEPWTSEGARVLDENEYVVASCGSRSDADLIAESRNALPGLIAALREAVTALEQIEQRYRGNERLLAGAIADTALTTIKTLLKP